jgi:L-alanine-DL-glutamate epimerase-like enolase superfamily enzyme
MTDSRLIIEAIDVWPVDVALSDPFVISRGAVSAAALAWVRVRLAGGVEGFGEIAPFTALTGETREESVAAAEWLAAQMREQSCADWEAIARTMRDAAPSQPAARCGLECALVDAFARAHGAPLYEHWRNLGAPPDLRERDTDITLPMLDATRVDQLAAQWFARGFRTFKMKVGGDVDADARTVERLAERYPEVGFILDANQGFDLAGARRLVRALARHAARIHLIEQPLARDDIDGMAALCADRLVPIAADESVFTLDDARRVIASRAADCINLKIMKTGLAETIEVARAAKMAGLSLMIGGMMESRLAMSFSWSLALATGWIDHFDLDTPLLMAADPLEGGYGYRGPAMTLWTSPGVGMRPRQPGKGIASAGPVG